MDDFAENEADGAREDRAIEDEGVEFTVFAAGIDAGREIGEESCIEFAAGEAGIEDFGVDANGDRAKSGGVEFADEFAGVAFPNGEKGLHRDTREIFFPVKAEIFEEDVTESDATDSLLEIRKQRLFHAGFVDRIVALRRDEDLVQRQAERLRLPEQKFAANAVHADAIVALGHGGEQSRDAHIVLAEQRVQREGAVFAAAPAEEDGFRWRQVELRC